MLTVPDDDQLQQWGQKTMLRNTLDEDSMIGKYLKQKYQALAQSFFHENNINGSETIKVINTIGIASAPSIAAHFWILHRHHGRAPHEVLAKNKKVYLLATFGFGTGWAVCNLLYPRHTEKTVFHGNSKLPSMYKSFDLWTPDSINFDTLAVISGLIMGYSVHSNHFRESSMVNSMFQNLKVKKSKNYGFAVLLSFTAYLCIQSAMVTLDIGSIRNGKRKMIVEKYITDMHDESSIQKRMAENRKNYRDLKRIDEEGFNEKDMENVVKKNDLCDNTLSVVGQLNEKELMGYLDRKS